MTKGGKREERVTEGRESEERVTEGRGGYSWWHEVCVQSEKYIHIYTHTHMI